MRPPLVLTGYLPSAPVGLSVTERDSLRGLVPGLTIEPVAGSTDTYTITGGSSVGVVRLGDLTVELRPKVGIAPVLFLLSYALDPRAWREPHAELVRDMNLAEAIVPLFARAAQTALRPGLLHGYRTRDDTLATVRGRVRMADQMRSRTGLPLPIEVVYDEFTPNHLGKQAAAQRCRRARPAVAAAPGVAACARWLHQRLNGVGSLIVNSGDVPEPVWTRLNERYRPAVSLARLIVTTAGLEAQAGGEDASAFVVDMNAVFEGFVRAALREELRLDAKAFPAASGGHTLYLDTGRFVSLKPDLSWWDAGRCVFAGDCKYKRTFGAVPNADIYQMLAYLTALQLPEGLLIYALGDDLPPDLVIEQASKRVHARTLDVSRPPAQLMHDVRSLAQLVCACSAANLARNR